MSFLFPKLGLITVKEKRNLKARFTRPGGMPTRFYRDYNSRATNNIYTFLLSPSSLGLNSLKEYKPSSKPDAAVFAAITVEN